MDNTISFDQLQAMGAKPINATAQASPDTVSFSDLQKMGAKPLGEGQPAAKARSSDALVNNPVGNFVSGAIKGAGSTLKTLGTVGQSFANNTVGRLANLVTGKGLTATPGPLFPNDTTRAQGDAYTPGTPAAAQADASLTPKGTAQTLGYGGEKIAELMTPTGIEGAATKSLSKLAPELLAKGGLGAKVATYATKSAASALDQGGKAALGGNDAQQSGGVAALGAVSPFVERIAQVLPTRLVRGALPKLSPGNEGAALTNTNLGSVSSMLADSQKTTEGFGKQIKTILTGPKYATNTGAGDFAVQATLHAFPQSEYTADSVLATAKKLVPDQAKLIDKIANGTATLAEKNTVRSGLDSATKKRFTDNYDISPLKEVGAKFADNLRAEVQAHAEETQPIFADYSKELDLQKALASRNKQLENRPAVGLLDILSALAGGLPAIAGERFARSPAMSIGVAKAVSKLNNIPQKLPGLMQGAAGATTEGALAPNQ